MARTAASRGLTAFAAITACAWSSWHCGTERGVASGTAAEAGEAGEGGALNVAGAQGEAGAAQVGGGSATGDRCEDAERVHVPSSERRRQVVVNGTTRGASNDAASELSACAGLGDGPDRFHLLDLRDLSQPVYVRAIVDASFDALLTLDQGPCEDSRARVCDRASSAGRAASTWAVELDPGEYRVVVDGATSGDAGDYRLTFVVEPLGVSCAGYENVSCHEPLLLPVDLPVVSAFVPPSCDDEVEDETLYYLLDLTAEADLVGILVSVQLALGHAEPAPAVFDVPRVELRKHAPAEQCGDQVVAPGIWERDGATISGAVPPGMYALVLHDPPAFPTFLSVSLTRPDCSGNQHDTCAEAQDIELVDGHATIRADTLCNTDRLALSDCSGDSPTPDRFYRLDLSERPGRTRLLASLLPRDLDFYALIVLLREEGGECGEPLMCYDKLGNAEGWPAIDAVLEPGVYQIAVEALEPGAAGDFTLDVNVSEAASRDFRPCYDGDIDACVFFTNDALGDCCTNPFGEDCGTRFVSCGLDPRVQDCVCEADARCCDGTDEDFERCTGVLAECSFFCGHEPASLFACLDQPELRPAGLE